MKNVDAFHMHLALFFTVGIQRNIFKDRCLKVSICILLVFYEDILFASSLGK